MVRVVDCANSAAALDFVHRVGTLAEVARHDPNIDIRWNQVTPVSLKPTTHGKGSFAQQDVALAAGVNSMSDKLINN